MSHVVDNIKNPIPLCVPTLSGKEWDYIKQALDSNWVSSVGPYVDQFEERFSDYVGTDYAVATVNGTSALHVALLVAGIQPNDEVLVSTLTFIAPVNAIRYTGAWPVFMDADPDCWQMDVTKVKEFITKECRIKDGEVRNKVSGRRVKALLPVHILGHPVDMDPLLELAENYGLVVIEDATESLGATYKDRKVGTLGDIACFSFNGNKIITTGGGGMITTNNQTWAEKAKYLTTQAKDDPVEFVHNEIGYNYRLTNIQAAMGLAQLEQLDAYIEKKRAIAVRYNGALKGVEGITLMPQAPWVESIFWLYTILIDEQKCGMSSRDIMASLKNKDIQTRPLWNPIHKNPCYTECQAYNCEVSEFLHKQVLSLPSSVSLTLEQQDRVIEKMKESLSF